MPWNLLIFPLLAGYFFVAFCNVTSIYHKRLEKQRLLFNSALVGIGFLILSFLLVELLKVVDGQTAQAIETALKQPYFLAASLSLPLSILVTSLVNWRTSETKAASAAIKSHGSNLEVLLLESFISYNEVGIPPKVLFFNLKSGNTVAGFVTMLEDPKELESIRVSPVLKGYWDKDNHQLVIVENYLSRYFAAPASNALPYDLSENSQQQDTPQQFRNFDVEIQITATEIETVEAVGIEDMVAHSKPHQPAAG